MPSPISSTRFTICLGDQILLERTGIPPSDGDWVRVGTIWGVVAKCFWLYDVASDEHECFVILAQVPTCILDGLSAMLGQEVR